jgi:translocation and assembly module TamA
LLFLNNDGVLSFDSSFLEGHALRTPAFLLRALRCGTPHLLLLALCIPFLSYAQTEKEAKNYIMEIDGAGPLEKLLREHLDISRRESEEEEISADELQRLVAITPEQINELLATEGYFTPTIRYDLDRRNKPWIARFNVQPGPPTMVEAVDIRFSGEVATGPNANPQRMNRLRRIWSLDPGDRFRQAEWSDAKTELLKGLLNRDYPAAAITNSEARIDPQKNTAVLTVEIDSGPVFTFGELEIQGLSRYPRDIVDRANPIKPGEPYSQDKLNEFQVRMQETGYFRSAFATVDVDPKTPHHVPIKVDITENERKRLGLGVGFSTDTGPRGQIKWLDRNFLEQQWRLESDLRIDRETYLLAGEVFLRPIDIGWIPSVGARYERTDTSGEVNDKIRTYARIASPNRVDEKTWGVGFYADHQQIGDAVSNHRQALVGLFNYTRRRLDHPVTPRSGYLASIELAAGPSGLVNDTNIARVFTRGTWIVPLVSRWRSVLRGQVGQVFGGTRQTVPDDLLFRTGGDLTVRGYGYNTLGVSESGATVAGTVTAVLSAELVYQITQEWGAAVFTDTGNAADSWSTFEFKRGTGAGARWRSPIGPVNFDLAYGHDSHEVRLHFSIGYGF